tara:strand:+ start:59 stop:883 length:825 start_codon:yes stop_codon:yes gene_type:complete
VLNNLLALDVTFHGAIVRDTIVGIRIDEFLENSGEIVGTAKTCMKVYIERTLSPICIHKCNEYNKALNIVRYVVQEKNTSIEMPITIGYLNFTSITSNITFPKPDIDVNLLSINREALFVRTIPSFNVTYEPAPLCTLLRQCMERSFNVLYLHDDNRAQHVSTLSVAQSDAWLIKRVRAMLKKGWTNAKANIKQTSCLNGDICTICQTRIAGNCLETTCRHKFHEACWVKYINHAIVTNATNNTNTLFPTSSPSINNITCPVCRAEMLVHNVVV